MELRSSKERVWRGDVKKTDLSLTASFPLKGLLQILELMIENKPKVMTILKFGLATRCSMFSLSVSRSF